MIPGTVTTHEVPLARALCIRERSEGRVIDETEVLMEEGIIVLLRDDLRGARRVAADCRPMSPKGSPSSPTRRRQGRRRCVLSCRPPRRCVAAYCHAGRNAHHTVAPIGCDEASAHHACGP
jgi:hypothetical protein